MSSIRETKLGCEVAIEQHWDKINIKMQFNKLNISLILDRKKYLQKTVRSSKVFLSKETPKKTQHIVNQRSEGFHSRGFYLYIFTICYRSAHIYHLNRQIEKSFINSLHSMESWRKIATTMKQAVKKQEPKTKR